MKSHGKVSGFLWDYYGMREMEKEQPASVVTFGSYRLDLTNAQLWRGIQKVRLTGKVFGVLRYFVAHPGQLVTKDDLFEAVWPQTVVSESTLASCIQELRQALHDKAKAPRHIETVHRRGYRFLPAITALPVGKRQKAEGSQQNTESRIQKAVSSEQRDVHEPGLPSADRFLPTGLVGRDSELTQLHSFLAKAMNGDRQLVFVTGETGIGKTALVEAFLANLRQRGMGDGEQKGQKAKGKKQKPALSGVEGANRETAPRSLVPVSWIAWGQCIEHYGAGEPYLPVLEALGRLCRALEGQRLIALLAQQAPTWVAQMPALLNETELESLQRKTVGATKERMLRELAEALEVLTVERPLVLWLEDLHWSDPSTLDWLACVARRRERARLLILGSYRPVEAIVREHPLRAVKQELQVHGQCAELALGLLSEAAVGEYLAVRFAVGAQGPAPLRSLVRTIHQRTDGNPLFMVNVVDALIAQGLTTSADGQGSVEQEVEQATAAIPENLRQLIEQQLEQLKPEERRMLEVASVAGLDFSVAAVAAGLETAVEAIEEQGAELARRGQFLQTDGVAEWPDGTVAGRYRFLHALYQEVIHERLPEARRRVLHRHIGERKEAGYGEHAREIAAELAVHFEQGRDHQRAVQYLQQASENAVQHSAYQEAISLLTRGLELLKTLPDAPERNQQELNLQMALGIALMTVKGYTAPEVEATYTRAYVLCQGVGDAPQLFPVLCGLHAFYYVRAEHQRARELAEHCFTLARSAQNSTPLVEAHGMLGISLLWLGELAAARAHLQEGVTLYNPRQHRSLAFFYGHDPGVLCYTFLAYVLWHMGYPDQASRRIYEALALAQELDHPFTLAFALANVAMVHQLRREEASGQMQAEAALILATEQGFGVYVAMGTMLRGWALAGQEQVEEGITQIRQGLAIGHAMGARMDIWVLVSLAEAHRKGEQAEEGLSALAEALAQLERTGERLHEAELYRLKGELTLQQERQQATGNGQQGRVTDPRSLTPDPQAEAEACFLKALEIAKKQHAKMWELRATVSLARLWQRQGKKEQARQMLGEIYGWFTEGFDTKDLQEVKALLEALERDKP
jgi:DNA-binding winged helix-turn-helix (wHTH) protein/tetratricopeptide (TPR) repeat protein